MSPSFIDQVPFVRGFCVFGLFQNHCYAQREPPNAASASLFDLSRRDALLFPRWNSSLIMRRVMLPTAKVLSIRCLECTSTVGQPVVRDLQHESSLLIFGHVPQPTAG